MRAHVDRTASVAQAMRRAYAKAHGGADVPYRTCLELARARWGERQNGEGMRAFAARMVPELGPPPTTIRAVAADIRAAQRACEHEGALPGRMCLSCGAVVEMTLHLRLGPEGPEKGTP